jgi:uncharacterized protein
MGPNMKTPQQAILRPVPNTDALVKRIVDAVHPLRIVLFGSAARGEMTPDSDVDILVVVPNGTHRLKTTRDLYERMSGLGYAVDIIVATPSILDAHKDDIGLIYHTVLAEGQEIYAQSEATAG